MNKEAILNEVYQSAFDDEIQKIAEGTYAATGGIAGAAGGAAGGYALGRKLGGRAGLVGSAIGGIAGAIGGGTVGSKAYKQSAKYNFTLKGKSNGISKTSSLLGRPGVRKGSSMNTISARDTSSRISESRSAPKTPNPVDVKLASDNNASEKYKSDIEKIKSNLQMRKDYYRTKRKGAADTQYGVIAGAGAGGFTAGKLMSKIPGKVGKTAVAITAPLGGSMIGSLVGSKTRDHKRDKYVKNLPDSSKFKKMWQENRGK